MVIRRIYKSFSFRLAFLSLLVFLTTLFILRYSIFYSAINEAQKDIKFVIEGDILEIGNSIKKNGEDYGLNIINSMLDNDKEKMFVILYADKTGKILEGNLSQWPELKPRGGKWSEFSIYASSADGAEPEEKKYLAKVEKMPKGAKMLMAYDLRHVEKIREILLTVLWQNIALSLIAAIFCSAIVTAIISKRLRVMNKTCEDVMRGELDERVSTTGGDDEFDRLANNFNSMLGWINQLILNIKDTTDNLAHDMRTPLNRHRIRLEAIVNDAETPQKTKEQITEAVKEIDRVVEMFNSILSISKAEAKSDITEFTNFDLRGLADDLLDLYSFLAEQKNIRLVSHVPESIEFKGDRQLFAQALMNLIDNAIKYTPENGRVEIAIEEDAEEVKITVADTGGGIPEEFHEKVKERFYRLDKSRTTPGSGLGLSLADAVVKLHKGNLNFANSKDGLVVTMLFKK